MWRARSPALEHSPAGRRGMRRLGLAGAENLPARVLSAGAAPPNGARALALSDAMPLWILDEPFAALDPSAIDCVDSTLIAEHVRGAQR